MDTISFILGDGTCFENKVCESDGLTIIDICSPKEFMSEDEFQAVTAWEKRTLQPYIDRAIIRAAEIIVRLGGIEYGRVGPPYARP